MIKLLRVLMNPYIFNFTQKNQVVFIFLKNQGVFRFKENDSAVSILIKNIYSCNCRVIKELIIKT